MLSNNNNMLSNNNTLARDVELINKDVVFNRADFDLMVERALNPSLVSAGKETVLFNKDSVMNQVNEHLAKTRANEHSNREYISDGLSKYVKWRKENEVKKFEDIWEKVKKKESIVKIVNEQKDLTNSNIIEINDFVHSNKQTIISEFKTNHLAQSKPLGSEGDISINDLITKGFEALDTPLVKLIKESVNVSLLGYSITSMIMYKAVVNLYMKSAYSSKFPDLFRGGPSTKSREIALFMIMGAPIVVGTLMGINKLTSGGAKVILNIGEKIDLEVPNSASSSSSSLSFFLFLNKLPPWLKALLKYIALYLIGLFIVKVFGYNSNIFSEIYSQLNIYLVYLLKIWTILNFFVVIYYFLRLYLIKMFANNKEFLNPEDYSKLIKNELIEWKNIAINNTPLALAQFYKHCYFLLLVYISIVIMGITGVVLFSAYL